jgi:hypothetical protein
MKKIILIVFLLPILVIGRAQTHQNDILSFVDKNMGKKVGRGVCYELVQSAIRTYDSKYDMGSKKDNKRYGKKVNVKKVQPGDVVLEKGPRLYHVGIVYKVVNDSVYVAEQNTNGCIKNSIVEVNYLDYAQLQKDYSGTKVSFYRPE